MNFAPCTRNGTCRSTTWTAAALLALPLIAAGQCSLSLSAQGTISLAEGPISLATGDLNGDGWSDVITIGRRPDQTMMLRTQRALSLPGAGFEMLDSMPLGNFFPALAVADFNGDGRADIATVGVDRYVDIRLAQPDGTLAAPLRAFPYGNSSGYVGKLQARDLNGDGRMDLVVLDAFSGEIIFLLGDGTGRFVAGSRVTPALGASTIALGDFNDDGRVDVAVSATNRVLMAANLPTRLAFTQTNDVLGSNIVDMVGGDFNRDGRGDLAVLTEAGLQILLRNSNPLQQGFSAFSAGPVTTSVAGAASLTLADLSGDGVPDLVISGAPSDSVALAIGRTDGTFGFPTPVFVGGAPRSTAILDVDRDGSPDIVAAGVDPARLSFLRSGAFAQQPRSTTASPDGTATFTVGAVAPATQIRWRRNGVFVEDGPNVGGSHDLSLSLTNLTRADNGSVFDAVITGECVNVRTNPASLTVGRPEATCPQDFNYDGEVNADDLGDFITIYFGPGC